MGLSWGGSMASLCKQTRVISRDGGEGAELAQKPWKFLGGEAHWFGTAH